MTRLRGIAVALGCLVGLVACSTVPTDSATIRITQVAGSTDDGDVGIEPLGPEPGATPEEIVRGFIDASASTTRNHPVARSFLTSAAAGSWSDSDGVTVLDEGFAAVAVRDGVVQVSGGQVGTVDQRGVFAVGDGSGYTRTFTLAQESGEWRISDPPDGLLLQQPDFVRTYDQVDAYFLDPTSTRVVPDPRYLVSGAAQANALVERLLEGPSPTLSAGVGNALAGADLRSTVAVDGRVATVDLAGLADASAAALDAISAQLVYSLTELSIGSVRLLVDGQTPPGVPIEQTRDDRAGYLPDSAPADAVGHYVADGRLRVATDSSAAPGPAGKGDYDLVSAAVSADPRKGTLTLTAGVSAKGSGQTLYAGSYGGDLEKVLSGSSFTPPTTAGTRTEVWTVRDGDEVVRLPSDGAPQTVTATTLAGLGRVTQFQLSPDGVRVAVVIEGAGGGQLYLGSVVRTSDSVSVRDLRSIAPTLRSVSDVAWRTAGTLLVLAADAGGSRMVPYSVDVDGWALQAVTTAGLPGAPTSVAAAPGRDPLVSADGSIWQLSGGTWSTLVRGAKPVAGAAPFYPG